MIVSDIMTTLNDNLIANLNLLGLDKNDSQVYLALLELGPSRVWDIAKASGVKRPTCYITLEKLVNLGAATKTQDVKHMIFTATSPKSLWALFESKRQIFKESLNELEALSNKETDKPQVRMFEGLEGIKQAYNLTLELPKGTEILFYSRNFVEEKYPDFFHEYLQARVKYQIKCRGIFPDSAYLIKILPPRDQLELRKSRFIPTNIFNPKVDSTIFANKVLHIAYAEKNPYATVIESATLAADEKERFELLWTIAQTAIEK